MIPENFNNKDTVFHYCKTKTAIEHILFNREIRLSPRNNSNDPIENISFKISESIAITDNNIESTNFLISESKSKMGKISELVEKCRIRGLYIRNVAITSPRLGERMFRVAVKDKETNNTIVKILADSIND